MWPICVLFGVYWVVALGGDVYPGYREGVVVHDVMDVFLLLVFCSV